MGTSEKTGPGQEEVKGMVEILNLKGICLNRTEILGISEIWRKRITKEGPWEVEAGEKAGQCRKAESLEQLEWNNYLAKKPQSSKLGDDSDAEGLSGE